MAEFTKLPTFFTSHQVNSNQVALRKLGSGKVAQNRAARAEDAQYGLRSKFTNRFHCCRQSRSNGHLQKLEAETAWEEFVFL